MSGLWDNDYSYKTTDIITNPEFQGSRSNVRADGQPDATIVCGSGVWEVHLKVVCGRSPVLNDLLKGGALSHVRLDGDPEVISLLLHFLSSGDISYNNDEEHFKNVARAWDAGWQFKVGDLLLECLEQLKQLLKRMVVQYQHLKCENLDWDIGNLAVFDAFKACLRAAYGTNIKLMKELFVLFVEDTHYWVLKEQPFREVLDSTPEYAADICRKAGVRDYRRLRVLGIPTHCIFCFSTVLSPDNHWADVVPGEDGSRTSSGSCYKCYQKLDDNDYGDDDEMSDEEEEDGEQGEEEGDGELDGKERDEES
ncbi:hypothetical protein GGR53DRAFT_497977 [Hypoxylon sp. FL1150]|nr:hypothetical protein GGR53DRAFT_497977 [Hypoxylon sp. FL1150]